MLKYGEQLQAIMKDQSAVIKFHSLRPQAKETVVPWVMQVSMRDDELQTLLTLLQGNTVWRDDELQTLLTLFQGNTVWSMMGMSLKPHSMTLSRPAQQLKDLMWKGPGKGHNF